MAVAMHHQDTRWWITTMRKRVRHGACISCGRQDPHSTRYPAKQVTQNGAMLCGLCVVCGWDSPDQFEVYERRAGMEKPR